MFSKHSLGFRESASQKKQYYKIAIGYDLTAITKIHINENKREVLVEATMPQVLYEIPTEPETIYRSDGIVNKLNDLDEADIRRRLLRDLHDTPEYKALLDSRFAMLRARFCDLMSLSDYKIEVRESSTPLEPQKRLL